MMTFDAFRNTVNQNAADGARRWVYRGHADASWLLVTSYGRFFAALGNAESMFDLTPFYSMMQRFLLRGSEISGDSIQGRSLFQKMALAQHHGVPTPLLDWTHSPYVAAYFAASGAAQMPDGSSQFVVYGLDAAPVMREEVPASDEDAMLSGKGELFRFLDTKNFVSRRVSRQAGCFTYHGFGAGLVEWNERNSFGLEIRRYEIWANRSNTIRELRLMGISGGTLFDDLDYVARDVRAEEEDLVTLRRLRRP